MVRQQGWGKLECAWDGIFTVHAVPLLDVCLLSVVRAFRERTPAQLEEQQTDLSMKALQAMNWRNIWALPALAAGVILFLFAVLFKDDAPPNGVSEQDVAEAAATEEYP